MSTNTPPAGDRDHTTAGAAPAQSPRFDAHPHEPLPYGTGYTTPDPLGFGVSPGSAPASSGTAEVAERRRFGSPVLAVAGLASLAVAVWAILGAPVISTTVLLAAGLVVTVLVGLMMVLRR